MRLHASSTTLKKVVGSALNAALGMIALRVRAKGRGKEASVGTPPTPEVRARGPVLLREMIARRLAVVTLPLIMNEVMLKMMEPRNKLRPTGRQ